VSELHSFQTTGVLQPIALAIEVRDQFVLKFSEFLRVEMITMVSKEAVGAIDHIFRCAGQGDRDIEVTAD
jgi:hypothetical protein